MWPQASPFCTMARPVDWRLGSYLPDHNGKQAGPTQMQRCECKATAGTLSKFTAKRVHKSPRETVVCVGCSVLARA